MISLSARPNCRPSSGSHLPVGFWRASSLKEMPTSTRPGRWRSGSGSGGMIPERPRPSRHQRFLLKLTDAWPDEYRVSSRGAGGVLRRSRERTWNAIPGGDFRDMCYDSDSSLVVEGTGRRLPPRELSRVSVLHRLFHSRQHGRDCGGRPWKPTPRLLERSFVVESIRPVRTTGWPPPPRSYRPRPASRCRVSS